MPSLQQLNEFKTSFRNIGNEAAVLAEQNIGYRDLPLPDSEPAAPSPFDAPAPQPAPADTEDPLAGLDFGDSTLAGDAGIGDSGIMDDFAFNDFLNTSPDDLPAPPEPDLGTPEPAAVPEEPAPARPPEEGGSNADVSDDNEDFTLPEDLLSGFADELSENSDGEEEWSESSVLDDLSFDDVPEGDIPDEAGGETEAAAGAEETGTDLPPDDEFTLPDMETDSTVEPKDAFDEFSFEGGIASPEPADETGDQKAEKTDNVLSDINDFSLPGIDDIFNKAAAAGTPGTVQTAGAAPVVPKTIEDITLTDEDLARFRETLASYPLNLRLACEEIIAEQPVPVDQMDALIRILVKGGPPKEAAALAGRILNRTIPVSKGFEKKTGEALEEEQTSFAYVFSRKFLPVLRIFLIALLLAASAAYLAWQFIYIPIHSESIYRRGYERIAAGEYERANERFSEAFRLRRVKPWFYRYAEAFRDERQYLYAEDKYDELLGYYPRDKKGAFDYANLETNYLRNYAKADRIIRTNILDYNVDDQEGLIAQGDNNMAWGEVDPSRYENARQAYARLLEVYGWRDPIVERMLLYFIRIDNLEQVIPLQQYLTADSGKQVSPAVLSELGGYLLDKQLEDVRGVPDANIERIEGVRDILIRASQGDPALPEPRYHLARYYNRFGYVDEERRVLETAIRAFDAAREESSRRTGYRIDAERRYAQVLTNAREFFPAEEQLIKGVGIYEDALSRRLLTASPEYGRLYADLGDLEYFTKSRDMNRALEYYRRSEQNGWAPPEIQYRMGAAHYHLGQWASALERFFTASSEMPLNRRLLHALGNVSYLRGNFFAAQGYYRRLLDLLEAERSRFPMLSPNDRPDHMELAERIMVARNNMGVTMEALTDRSGDPRYRTEAMALYAESSRAWDALTRNPDTMGRSTGTNLGFLNSRNILYPQAGYEPRLFNQIDKDILEPSAWETLVPSDYRLSD